MANDKQLIDLSALGIGERNPEVFNVPERAYGWNDLLEILKTAPAVDAVEVVRCLKCRHSDTQCHKDGLRYCMRPIKADDYNETGYIYPLEVIVRDDDFCSYGEVNRL